ncbi:hypothetical protein [Bacillus alkalicellulosilyticus]|nr:hypothetical protein [Bacillus alkalicellulosilyticus]
MEKQPNTKKGIKPQPYVPKTSDNVKKQQKSQPAQQDGFRYDYDDSI